MSPMWFHLITMITPGDSEIKRLIKIKKQLLGAYGLWEKKKLKSEGVVLSL